MLLNAAPSQLIPAGNGTSPDASGDVIPPAPPPAAPKSGRALLAALEQQAQGRMVQFQQALRARGRLQGRWLDWGYPGPIEPLRETGRIAAQVREALGIPA